MARKIVFAWGRFNPPTTGHKVVMDRVAKEAKSRKADYAIFASKSNDPKKNPLTFRTKVKFLKQSFPKHAKNINASPGIKTVFDVMKFLDKRYQEVSLVVGADRAQELKKLLTHYNGREYDFEEIEIISAGARDPDADDVTGMSASKMRKFAVDGNYKEFKKGSPMKNPKELYNAIRRGMKINEEVHASILEAHEFDVTDRKVAGRRFNAMLRFGLVPNKYIPITKRAFSDLEQAGPNPELRKHILDVTDKVLEYIMADDLLYRRFLLLLHDNFLMKEDHCDALLKKAEKSQLSYTSLLEVFLRGLAASPIYGDKTAHQYAFDRVNSYVAGGHSRKTLDADIWESTQQKNIGRKPMKRLRDTAPPKWGTKEMADRYSKVIPGQSDDIGESAPSGAEAEAFIKDNKGKFKERYGDKWEQVLYATAWKVYGKNESVDEASPYKNPNKDGMISKTSEKSAARAAKARRDIRIKLANRKKKAAQKTDEEFEMDEARSAGYKMPQSKDPYTVKYGKSKRGPIQTTVVDGEKAAKKFLADVKKQGMNGIITKGGHQKDDFAKQYVKSRKNMAKTLNRVRKEEFEITESDKAEYDKLMKQYGDMPASKIPPKTYMRISQLGRKVRGDKGGPKVGDLLKSMKKRKMGEDVEQVDEAFSSSIIKKMREVLVRTAKGDIDVAMRINDTLPDDAKKVLTKVKNTQQLSKHLKANEEVEIDEAKMGEIARNVKKGDSPYTVVAIVNKKVVDQDHAKVADQVPALVRELKKEYPNAKISVEDRGGRVVHSESFVDEGRIGGGRRSFRGSGMKHIRVRDDEGYRKDGSNPVDDAIAKRNAARRKFAARKVPANVDKNKDPKKKNEEVDEVEEGAIGRVTRAIGNIKDKRITSKDDAARKEKRKINFKKRLKDANREAQWEREDGRKGDSPGTRIKDAQSYAASRSEPSDKAREAAKRIKARRIRQGAEDRRKANRRKANEEADQVDEGGMIGRTKPSRELNVSREEKPHLAGKSSLKDKKRDAHKAERAKAKKQLKSFKNY